MTLLKRRILRIGAVSGAALLAAACAETQLGAQAVKEVARSETRANTGPELAPEAFDATGLTIWDGASTLEGVWIAHPLAQRAQRVRVTNLENQIDVEGAMFRRDPTLSGPSILVSSDAARLLGLQPGVPTELRIIALREGVYAAPTATAGAATGGGTAGASDVETTSLAAPEPQESEAEEDIAAAEADAEEAPVEATTESSEETVEEPSTEPAAATETATATEAAEETATETAEATTEATAPPPPKVRERERPKSAITAADLRGDSTVATAPASNPQPAPAAPAPSAPAQPEPKPAQPEPTPSQTASTPAAATGSGAYQGQLPKGRFVQAGAFGVEPNAASLVQALRDAGLPAQYVQRNTGGSLLNIVMVGPLADDAAADAAIEAAAKAGAPGARKVIR